MIRLAQILIILFWDFTGNYEVFDVVGFENLKMLTLNYELGDVEEFELTVVNDQRDRIVSP